MVADPARLPLADHVHRLVSLYRSPSCVELAKALLGLHSSFDRSMILLQDVVQILDRSMAAAAAQGSFRLHCGNRRAVEAGLISVDDAGLRMRWIAERLAEQALARRGIAQRREQEVDGGTRGIDGPIEVTPSALHSNIGLIDAPGFVGRLKMAAQPLLQFGTVTLNPTPDRCVIRLQTALGEQLFDVAERERVPERFQAGQIKGLSDERTISQLAVIRYRHSPRGQVVIESKEEMRRRGVKSPDRALNFPAPHPSNTVE